VDPKSGTFERSLNIQEWAAPSCSTRCTHGGTSHACRADRLENQRLNKANPLMSATSNFTLGFAPASESKVESTDWLLSRQLLQRIATRISLVSEAIGFSILGILIIANRYQADLNGLATGSGVAILGGLSALLVGTVFLVSAYVHWRFCARHSAAPPVRRQLVRFTFSRPRPVTAIGMLSV